MTGDGGADLPNDLLGAIYNLCFSSNDRRRFAAVCKSWRAVASWQQKLPALPLLLPSTGNSCLDKKARAYSPEDGRVLRSRLPWVPYGKQIVGSYDGGWVAAAFGGRIEIVNLFRRGCRVPVKGHIAGGISIEKVVFSDDPTSEGCILAAMTTSSTASFIALYRFGCPGAGWTTRGRGAGESFVDIAFFNDELYGLSCDYYQFYGHRLYKLAIGKDHTATIVFYKLSIQWSGMFNPKYIFALRGKLATAVKVKPVDGSNAQTFKVFELMASCDTAQSYQYVWAEVTNMDDHALFLGAGCCKAVHVSAVGRCGEVKGNHIYYSRRKSKLEDNVDPDRLDLGSCDMYCYENRGAQQLESIIASGYNYAEKGYGTDKNSCIWIFPPRF